MTEFEFVFVLYSLFLGFSLIELLTGLGNAMERKFAFEADGKYFEIGWLTPLLAIFVVLDLLSFWLFAWVVRDEIAVSATTLLAIAVFACAYFLASRLVFPSSVRSFSDLDVHYFRVRRLVLGILLALVFFQWAYLIQMLGFQKIISQPLPVGMTVVLITLMIAAMWAKTERLSIALLSLLIVRYVAIYLIT